MPRPTNTSMTFGFGRMPTDPKAIAIYKALGLRGHNGDDYGTGKPVPTYSIVEGTVVVAGQVSDGGGLSVRIRFRWHDGRDYIAQHDHLSRVDVKVGDMVKVGQQVGMTGSTGASTGVHLHFAIRPVSNYNPNDGYHGYINPKPFYEGGSMQTATMVLNTYKRMGGRTLNLDNKDDRAVYDEKVAYLDGGGDPAQFIDDVIRSASLYWPTDRVVDEIYGAGGYNPGDEVKAAKTEAIGGGFPPSQLIREVMPQPGLPALSPQDEKDLATGRDFRKLVKRQS